MAEEKSRTPVVAFLGLILLLGLAVTAWSLRFGGDDVAGLSSGSALEAPKSLRLTAVVRKENDKETFVLTSNHLPEGPVRVVLHPDRPTHEEGHGLVLVLGEGERLWRGLLQRARKNYRSRLAIAGPDLHLDDVLDAKALGVRVLGLPRHEDPWSRATALAPWARVTLASGADPRAPLSSVAPLEGTALRVAFAVERDGVHVRNDDWWATLDLDPPPCLTRGTLSGWTVQRSSPEVWHALQVARALDLRTDLRAGRVSFPAAALLVSCPFRAGTPTRHPRSAAPRFA